MTYKEAIEYLQPVADNTPLSGYGAALTAAIYALHQMEEGAVPVVRCKECEHFYDTNINPHHVCKRGGSQVWDVEFTADDFCSYGERRADNA